MIEFNYSIAYQSDKLLNRANDSMLMAVHRIYLNSAKDFLVVSET